MPPEHPSRYRPGATSLAAERFGRFAHHYVESPSHAGGADLDLQLEWARPRPEWIALDVATGGAHTALAFAPHVRRVVACDLAPLMLDAARRHASDRGATNVEFVFGDACNLPFSAEAFHLVTCRSAAHHFPCIEDFISEAERVLVPEGLLILQDQQAPADEETAAYVNTFERRRDPSHGRTLSEGAWRRTLTAGGLTVERTAGLDKRHDLEDWAVRQGQDAAGISELRAMLENAPETAQVWLDPQDSEGNVSFAIHHLIISARKTS